MVCSAACPAPRRHRVFLSMLPKIVRHARIAFRHLHGQDYQDAIQEIDRQRVRRPRSTRQDGACVPDGFIEVRDCSNQRRRRSATASTARMSARPTPSG